MSQSNSVVLLEHPHTMYRGDRMPTRNSKKRKSNLKLGKETYGQKNIEEAFKEAFTPYFVVEDNMSGPKKKTSNHQ